MMFDLPSELTAKPLALIGLSGLDVTNTIHRSIWDAFSNNRRPDGTTVQFKLLGPKHEFPTVKPKRNSYEWYIPKGILKRNWMNKYLNEIPAVVVVFYDLDWNDPLWNEKKIECASRIQSLRAALEGRSTKVALVLIQCDVPPPPDSEDIVATERATALCGACELPPNLLYVLPHGDHLSGYISRLETAFYQLAQNFYHHEYRIIRSHRDQLNKTVHQYLFVRHQFKMGFLNELKQDQPQKHYVQAYHNLFEIRMVDTNALEIKTIAGFINYKICKIMFSLNLPKDAIAQFRLHTERFKLKTGPKELIFEHHAWMSNQFSTFAELFDDAIRQGLPAVQTQHPGYYYQLAAQHASLRQSACKELCKNVNSYPDLDPLAGEEKLEFYGQRPWRSGKLNVEPLDTVKEAAAVQALQYKEKTTVNHSMIIIGLLGNAISQFKIYRCPRMRRSLVVQMAEEYYNSRDYGKVLTLLMHMLWEYHGERWPVLLTDIIKNALRAAYLSTSIQDYLTLSFEALGPSTTFTKDQQTIVYANIINILQKRPPHPEPDLPDDLKRVALEKWKLELNRQEPIMFTIDDNNMTSFIDVKAQFLKPRYIVDEDVMIEVIIRNSFSGSIEFSKVSVTINSPGFNTEIVVAIPQHNNVDLVFSSNQIKKFYGQFGAPSLCDSSEIRIGTVTLFMGNETQCCIVLRFPAAGKETNLLHRLYPEIQLLHSGKFETIKPLITTEIKRKESDVNISAKSNNPALLGEWVPIIIHVTAEDYITVASLHVGFQMDGNNEQSTDLSMTMLTKQSQVLIEIEKTGKNCIIEKTVYMRAHKVGNRNIIIKVEYCYPNEIKGSKEIVHSIPVSKPFEVTTRFCTSLLEPLTKGFIHEPFVVMPHISCTSPCPIKILDTSIELGELIQKENNQNEDSILAGTVLSDGEAGTDVYCLIAKAGSEQPVSIGVYTIKWIRANDETASETSSSVTLAPLWIEDAVISLETRLPAHGWVCTPLYISYIIQNHSDYLITLRLTMEASDAFMFAGQKQVDIYILPKNERRVEWILRPLVAGLVALPILSLTVPTDEEHKLSKGRLSEMLERSLPSHIYIMKYNRHSNNEDCDGRS
ncbi:trafficking protein particle complex subunit 11 isoform X1 [Vespula pensylvanica]|uniref:trafficking protein particle complex subunit 11 isoform X1 n=1 Tax=Vespula pensylvanica TaxID=30213 RepID=UPI001CB9F189|nr:trafficking protein particle complex subunit 11 isoform X1 [Vespula pensylvanica]XP_043685901.1 trafficking protein particle complex subunit 11 isoform X1 [Vespula pensylvanica]XP_043685902.1 trafficking protein particle complex subunit 11 isoform X1 [Vespula pensylvanica]XP_043685903.1 trafficking protein particle complex subunit 11 isoform X1 [Vespula pensylvanica]XP_043685904.1 trafficking protein particle complex subunit 11 isoform X1 [Vespula pensylvanica]